MRISKKVSLLIFVMSMFGFCAGCDLLDIQYSTSGGEACLRGTDICWSLQAGDDGIVVDTPNLDVTKR